MGLLFDQPNIRNPSVDSPCFATNTADLSLKIEKKIGARKIRSKSLTFPKPIQLLETYKKWWTNNSVHGKGFQYF